MSIAHILFFFSCKRRIALKNTVSFLFSILWVLQKNPIFPRTCLKKHSRNLHAPLCGIFHPNSVVVARYDALIRAKSPTNCDTHLAESLFQTRSKAVKSSIGIIIHLKYILSFRFAQRNNLIVLENRTDYADSFLITWLLHDYGVSGC